MFAQISWGQANPCDNFPCENGGTCTYIIPGDYSCDCTVGYFDSYDCPLQYSNPIATEPDMTFTTVLKNATNVALNNSIEFNLADPEKTTKSVLYFTITGGTVTLGSNSVVFGGDGNSSANFTAKGFIADLNLALDQATFTPTPELSGNDVASISFTGAYGPLFSNLASVTFSIEDSVLSVEDLNFENNIKLYPIPSNDILNIKNTSTDIISKITITDVLGKTVFKSNYDNLESSIKIKVSPITAGIYFINLSKNNYTSIRKIIIN